MASKNVSSTAPGGETVPAPHDHPFGPRRNNGTAPGLKEGGRLPVSGSRSGATASAASNASNASTAKKLMLPSGDVVDVPTGLDARLDRWGNVTYRVIDSDVVLRLVAELLLYVVRSYRGSVVRLDGRRISRLLGLRQRGGVSGYLEPYSMSRIYGVLSMLGFELSRSNHRITITIDLRKPIIREIKSAESIDEAIKIVEKHLR